MWVEQKSMIPPVAYLWLHQTLKLSAGRETGFRYEREVVGEVVRRSDRVPRERWKGLSQSLRVGQGSSGIKCAWIHLKLLKARSQKFDAV